MALSNFLRAGRFWLNPHYLVSVEDTALALSKRRHGGDLPVILKSIKGEDVILVGDDADQVRRALGADLSSPPPGDDPREETGTEEGESDGDGSCEGRGSGPGRRVAEIAPRLAADTE
jgi:hypothetical protein